MRYIILTVLGIFMAGCASAPPTWSMLRIDPSEYQVIGVQMEIHEPYDQISTSTPFKAMLQKELIKKGYILANPSDVERVIKELRRQHTDFYDSSSRQEPGKFLNVQALLSVTMNIHKSRTDVAPDWDLSAELILVKRNQVIGICTAQRDVNLLNYWVSLDVFSQDYAEWFMTHFPPQSGYELASR